MPDETVVAPPEKPVEQTTTETIDATDEIRGLIFGTEEEQAEIRAKGEERKKAEEEAKAAEAAAAAPKKPKPAPKPKPATEEEEPEPEPEPKPKPPKKLSTEELIRMNAEGTRDAVVAGVREAVEQTQRRSQPEPEPQPDPEKATLPASIKKNLEALRILGETKPDEFKDIESKAIKFWDEKNGELVKYRKAWQKENPGEEFDMDSPDHADWMRDNEPYVSEEDLEYAKEEAMRRKLRTEIRSEIEPLRRRVAEREADEKSAPIIAQTLNGSVKELVAQINPELKDLTDEELGADLKDKDPVAAHVILRTAPSYVPLISETIRLFSGKPYDPNNQVHVHLDRYAQGLEQSFAGMPPEQTYISGPKGNLRFATRTQYAKLSPAEKAKCWTVDKETIVHCLRRDWTLETTRSYQEYKTLVEAISGKTPPAPNSKPAPKPAAVATPPPEPEEEPVPSRSPSVRSSSPAPPPVPADDPSLRKSGSTFFEKSGW